jgi:hypothetical protein
LAAEGNSLISIDASVGLILADVAMTIGLTSIEQLQVFGAELADELKFVLVSAPGNNGNH